MLPNERGDLLSELQRPLPFATNVDAYKMDLLGRRFPDAAFNSTGRRDHAIYSLHRAQSPVDRDVAKGGGTGAMTPP